MMENSHRILVVIGSPVCQSARQRSHQLALDCLRRLPTTERWEAVLLDLLPSGRCEFPEIIAESGEPAGDSFTRFEATELLRTIRLDYACAFLTCRLGLEVFQQIIHDLKLRPLWAPGQKTTIPSPRWKFATQNLSPASSLARLSRIYPN